MSAERRAALIRLLSLALVKLADEERQRRRDAEALEITDFEVTEEAAEAA